MKKLIITLAIAITALFAGVQTASADLCYTPPVVTSAHKDKTDQIDCCHFKQIAYDHCSRSSYYTVAVYTWQDFSNDTNRSNLLPFNHECCKLPYCRP